MKFYNQNNYKFYYKFYLYKFYYKLEQLSNYKSDNWNSYTLHEIRLFTDNTKENKTNF